MSPYGIIRCIEKNADQPEWDQFLFFNLQQIEHEITKIGYL